MEGEVRKGRVHYTFIIHMFIQSLYKKTDKLMVYSSREINEMDNFLKILETCFCSKTYKLISI